MTNPDISPLGIIAGGGELPSLLQEACRENNRPYTVIAIEGSADANTSIGRDGLSMRIGEAAKAFEHLKNEGVREVVLAGKVQRPNLKDMMPDWRTTKFIARIGKRAFLERHSVGDDVLLRAVLAEFEVEGFEIVGVDEMLPNLLVQPGLIGKVKPNVAGSDSIRVGFEAAKELGQQDIGQAVVVDDGKVVLKESDSGTDALIAEAGSQRQSNSSLILVKTMKPGQDRRMDLPTIGPDTVTACVQSGFSGIAVEAGHTLVLNRDEVAATADDAGLFVIAVEDSRSIEMDE